MGGYGGRWWKYSARGVKWDIAQGVKQDIAGKSVNGLQTRLNLFGGLIYLI